MKLTREVVCKDCNGRGTNKEGVSLLCTVCKGSGMMTVTERPREGYLVQRSSPCTNCHGTGEHADDADLCLGCRGAKTVEEDHMVEIPIEPGLADGAEIRFEGEGSALPGIPNGDLIVVVIQKTPLEEGELFHRSGSHLITQMCITLRDALLGFETTIKHMDGHSVLVRSTKVIQPTEDAHLRIEGEGMPIPKTKQRGDLYVQFAIQFPTSISDPMRDLLEKALPASTTPSADDHPPLAKATDTHRGIFAKLVNAMKRRKTANE